LGLGRIFVDSKILAKSQNLDLEKTGTPLLKKISKSTFWDLEEFSRLNKILPSPKMWSWKNLDTTFKKNFQVQILGLGRIFLDVKIFPGPEI
jgi:hypothetical protein